MDSQQLQSFVLVVELGSLTEAAKKLGITPAAVSARVHGLESEIGASLLNRSGRVMRPTLAGVNILERSRHLLREMRDLRAIASSDTAVGELRLGAFPSAMTSLLPAVLESFYESFPSIQISVTSDFSIELCCRVSDGSLDAAIVVEPQYSVPKYCAWRPLLSEPVVLVVPSDLAENDPLELLAREPFIRYDRSVLGGQLVERYLREHDIVPRERLELDGLMAIAELVHRRLGIALLPDWRPIWHAGLDIARINLPGRPPVRKVGFLWSISGLRAQLAETFLAETQAVLPKFREA